MKNTMLLLSILLLQLSCSSNKDEVENSYPECLSSQINTILQSPAQNPRATIKKYNYQSQIVYEVNTNFADGKSSIYSNKCELLCENGGIDGQLNDCINWNNATYIETVWTDPR